MRGLAAVALLSLWIPTTVLGRSIEGSVRESGTRAPIPGAILYAVSQPPNGETEPPECFSDENGAFVLNLTNDATASYRIEIVAAGYENERQTLQFLPEQSTLKYDFYLRPGSESSTTRITERRSPADRARGAIHITEKEVNEIPGTYGDPAKAIENFPGMGRVVRSQGSLFVRGASPNDTAVYVDDFEVPDLYHFTGSTSVINIPFVRSVELIPGAFSARFGRATGGLVTLQTRKLPTDDVHGFAKIDVIDGGAYVGVPLSERSALGVSARRSWIDAIRWAQRANGAAQDEILNIPTYWDWQLKFDWDVAPAHELIVFAFGSGDRQVNVRDATQNAPAYQAIDDSDFGRVSMRYRHVLGHGFTHTFTPVIGYERRLVDEEFGLRRQERQTLDFQLRDELLWRGDHARVLVGVDATIRGDQLRYGGLSVPDATRAFPEADLEGAKRDVQREAFALRSTVALFTEGTFEPIDKLTLTPGLRLDGYVLEDVPYLQLEPRVSASYAVTENGYPFLLKTSAGLFSQPPTPEDWAAARFWGRNLDIQQAIHLQGGFEQGIENWGTLSTTLYAIWRDRLPIRDGSFPNPEIPLNAPVTMAGSGFSRGVEVLFRLERSKDYFAWVSYAVARHERKDGDVGGGVDYVYPTETDTSHLLTALGQIQLPWGFRVGARYRLATGMPFTDVAGSVWDADSARYIPVYSGKGQARYPTFHVLDLRIDWAMLYPWLEVDFYADLVNILNLRVEEDRIYSFDYQDFTPRLGLPTIPTLGVKVTF